MYLLQLFLHQCFVLEERWKMTISPMCVFQATAANDKTHLHPIGPLCAEAIAFDPETRAGLA